MFTKEEIDSLNTMCQVGDDLKLGTLLNNIDTGLQYLTLDDLKRLHTNICPVFKDMKFGNTINLYIYGLMGLGYFGPSGCPIKRMTVEQAERYNLMCPAVARIKLGDYLRGKIEALNYAYEQSPAPAPPPSPIPEPPLDLPLL